jgi:hypothetical protein
LNPFFAVGAKNMGFFGFLRISLKRKNPGKFFFGSKEAPWHEQSNGAKFIALCGLIRELWAFK